MRLPVDYIQKLLIECPTQTGMDDPAIPIHDRCSRHTPSLRTHHYESYRIKEYAGL